MAEQLASEHPNVLSTSDAPPDYAEDVDLAMASRSRR